MMKRRNILFALVVLLLAAFGCERRPLEGIYRSTVRVIIKCIWKVEAYPEGVTPSGVTMYFFRDGEYYTTITTSNVDSCEVQLPVGHYKMFMITQSPEEYWRMQFDNMTSFNAASTSLRESSAAWVTRTDDEVVVENPEIVCAGVSEEFEITTKMTEDYQYYYTNLKSLRAARTKNNTKAESKSGETKSEEELWYEERVEYYTIRIPVYPQNIVSQLWVTIYAGRADVLRSVRASTSGMARSFELTQNITGSGKAIQIISQWELEMDNYSDRIGHVDGIITTFGLPDGEMPSSVRDSTLNVSTLLVDNKTQADYVFSIGDKIQVLPPNKGYRGLYRLIFGSVTDPAIILPDVKPEAGGGGFVAGVEDWEEEIESNITL